MSTHPVDAAAIDHAVRQCGFVTWEQLKRAGATGALVTRRVRSGRFERVWPGLYLIAGQAPHPMRPLWEAQLIVGDQGVIAGPAAAWHHGSPAFPVLQQVTVLVPRPSHPRVPQRIRLHQVTDLAPEDVMEVDGLRITTPARTAVDLGTACSPARLKATIDDWSPRHLVTLDDIEGVLERLVRPGKGGLAVVAKVLDQLKLEPVPSCSALERALYPAVAEAGIVDLEHQAEHPGFHPGRELVDGLSRSAMMIVEGDGRRWHDRVAQTTKDRQRDLDASAAGWLTVRLTWRQLTRHRDDTVESLRQVYVTRLRQLGRGAA